MTGAPTGESPAILRPGLSKPVLGMSCALIGTAAFLYAGHQLFIALPYFRDVWDIWDSAKVRRNWISDFVSTFGIWVWCVLAGGTAWSLVLAFRRPGQTATLALNVGMSMLTIAFAWLVNQGMWRPLIRLHQWFGTE